MAMATSRRPPESGMQPLRKSPLCRRGPGAGFRQPAGEYGHSR